MVNSLQYSSWISAHTKKRPCITTDHTSCKALTFRWCEVNSTIATHKYRILLSYSAPLVSSSVLVTTTDTRGSQLSTQVEKRCEWAPYTQQARETRYPRCCSIVLGIRYPRLPSSEDVWRGRYLNSTKDRQGIVPINMDA